MGKDLQIEAVEAGGEHVVYLTGELDLANATAAEEALFGMSASKVTVDLSGLSFIDSSGVGALIEARRRMEENGNSVEFRGARDTVRRLLDVINWARRTWPWWEAGHTGCERLVPSPTRPPRRCRPTEATLH